MEKIPSKGHMDLSDRIAIETGIKLGYSFKKIAATIYRNPVSISREIQENRTTIPGAYPNGNKCKNYQICFENHVCGDMSCSLLCKNCFKHSCNDECWRYSPQSCERREKPPYVCNECHYKKKCMKEKYLYVAKFAQAESDRRRSESRKGIRISKDQLVRLDVLVSGLVRKGQPLAHIYAEHKEELPVGLRSIYNYIDARQLSIRNIDLRRKTRYKKRKVVRASIAEAEYRFARSYQDFLFYTAFRPEGVVEMDTVKGKRSAEKRLLTMIFRDNSIMLMFLIPDGKAESVKRVFDWLEISLGLERFRRLFPVILTDNGSEFKCVDQLELSDRYIVSEYRTHLYYCDPMASWQKPHIEKNHEYIRYVLPRGKSLTPYNEEDITLLMNHINSIKRPGLGNKSPYELIDKDDEDMQALFRIMKMHPIPADEVHLNPDLFAK